MTKVLVFVVRFFFSSYSSFHTNTKITLTQECSLLIELKFGTCAGQPKASISPKFCEDLTKILVVINNYSHKQRSICWTGYRVNCLLDPPDNQCIARLNIRGVVLVVKNELSERHEVRSNLGKNCAIDFCVIEIHKFQSLSDKPYGGISLKLLWLSTIHRRELYLKENRIGSKFSEL